MTNFLNVFIGVFAPNLLPPVSSSAQINGEFAIVSWNSPSACSKGVYERILVIWAMA